MLEVKAELSQKVNVSASLAPLLADWQMFSMFGIFTPASVASICFVERCTVVSLIMQLYCHCKILYLKILYLTHTGGRPTMICLQNLSRYNACEYVITFCWHLPPMFKLITLYNNEMGTRISSLRQMYYLQEQSKDGSKVLPLCRDRNIASVMMVVDDKC
jgi:hypothetical protein